MSSVTMRMCQGEPPVTGFRQKLFQKVLGLGGSVASSFAMVGAAQSSAISTNNVDSSVANEESGVSPLFVDDNLAAASIRTRKHRHQKSSGHRRSSGGRRRHSRGSRRRSGSSRRKSSGLNTSGLLMAAAMSGDNKDGGLFGSDGDSTLPLLLFSGALGDGGDGDMSKMILPLALMGKKESKEKSSTANTKEDKSSTANTKEDKKEIDSTKKNVADASSKASVSSVNDKGAASAEPETKQAAVTSGQQNQASVTSGQQNQAAVTSGQQNQAAVTSGQQNQAPVTSGQQNQAAVTSSQQNQAALPSAQQAAQPTAADLWKSLQQIGVVPTTTAFPAWPQPQTSQIQQTQQPTSQSVPQTKPVTGQQPPLITTQA